MNICCILYYKDDFTNIDDILRSYVSEKIIRNIGQSDHHCACKSKLGNNIITKFSVMYIQYTCKKLFLLISYRSKRFSLVAKAFVLLIKSILIDFQHTQLQRHHQKTAAILKKIVMVISALFAEFLANRKNILGDV